MGFSIKSVLFGMLVAFSLAGCNTLEGVGEDLEQGGEAIQRKAS